MKIAAASDASDLKKDKMKRWIRNAALMSGGAAAGALAASLCDKAISEHLGPAWVNVPPKIKKWVVGPALGLVTSGATLVSKRLLEEKKRTE